MTNIRFDGVELSSLGLSALSLNMRAMATWSHEDSIILGRSETADLSSNFETSTSVVEGLITADTDDWSNYTHDQLMGRVDAIKQVLHPKKGFRALVVSGDMPTRFRWARFQEMSFNELKPVFKLPHQAISLTFQNLDPWWRLLTSPIVVTSPSPIANPYIDDTRPLIQVNFNSTFTALETTRVEPKTIFTIDDLQVSWKGTASKLNGVLNSGDILTLDSDTLTATLAVSGTAAPVDVVRHYDFSGPGAYLGGGFPVIKGGGSQVTFIDPAVSSIVFTYDLLLP